MPLNLALPGLQSLTAGGALTPSSAAGPAISGQIEFGGVNLSDGPSPLQLAIVAGAVVAVAWLVLRS